MNAERKHQGAEPAGTAEQEIEAVDLSREELIAEADQFLDLSGADPETHDERSASN